MNGWMDEVDALEVLLLECFPGATRALPRVSLQPPPTPTSVCSLLAGERRMGLCRHEDAFLGLLPKHTALVFWVLPFTSDKVAWPGHLLP